MQGLRIEKLRRDHAVDGFECGQEALDRFLVRHALQSQQSGAATTWVALDNDRIVGFYSLAVGEIAFDGAAERLTKGLARHPVPVMLLARLPVSSAFQGRGLGAGLLKDAIFRTLAAADIAGIRALVTHAKDAPARQFYEHFGFTASPTDPLHLHVLLKDLKSALNPPPRRS